MKPTDFAIRLTNFLGEYLSAQKNVSSNTIKAYRDAFTFLLRYCRDHLAVSPENLTLDTLNASLVLSFLNYIENGGNCIRTRNQPKANIVQGHLSATLEHLANISHRAGNVKLVFDGNTETFLNNDGANKYLKAAARGDYRMPDEV